MGLSWLAFEIARCSACQRFSASPDDHGIAMRQGFVGQSGDVHAAHHDFDAALAEVVGDLVAALHRGGHGGDPDEVGFLVQVQRLDFLIDDGDLPAGRGQRGHFQQAQARACGRRTRPPSDCVSESGEMSRSFFMRVRGNGWRARPGARAVGSWRGSSTAGRRRRAGGAARPGCA